MGLDISYYGRAKFLRESDGEWDWKGGEVYAYPNSDFPHHADGLQAGIYKAESAGSFTAGAYGDFNTWRDQLAGMAGYGTLEAAWALDDAGADRGPFWELINFADNEGMIGPTFSARLAADFAAWQAEADALGGHFADRYRHWRKAFEIASDGGFVHFH